MLGELRVMNWLLILLERVALVLAHLTEAAFILI